MSSSPESLPSSRDPALLKQMQALSSKAQGKINSHEAAMDMAEAMEDARACAEAEAL